MQKREIEDARKYATWLKWGGVFTAVFGAVILIGSIFLMGAAMGRVESPFLEYEIPTGFAEAIAGLGILIGSLFIIGGATATHYASKIERVLSRRSR